MSAKPCSRFGVKSGKCEVQETQDMRLASSSDDGPNLQGLDRNECNFGSLATLTSGR